MSRELEMQRSEFGYGTRWRGAKIVEITGD